MDNNLVFYTDGSSKSSLRGGYACIDCAQKKIYYGSTPQYKIIDVIKSEDRIFFDYDEKVHMNPTNNRGELLGILLAVLLSPNGSTIYSDSKYCIGVYTEWYKNWIKNNTFTGKKNLDIIEITWNILQQKENIKFEHLYGHRKDTTFNTRMNNLADKYANFGADITEDTTYIVDI